LAADFADFQKIVTLNFLKFQLQWKGEKGEKGKREMSESSFLRYFSPFGLFSPFSISPFFLSYTDLISAESLPGFYHGEAPQGKISENIFPSLLTMPT
jgi:hypothetical protein